MLIDRGLLMSKLFYWRRTIWFLGPTVVCKMGLESGFSFTQLCIYLRNYTHKAVVNSKKCRRLIINHQNPFGRLGKIYQKNDEGIY